MKKCPKCKTVYGYRRGKPGTYRFCPLCGGKLEEVHKVYLTQSEWEELNMADHAVPWNTDINMKGIEDESF